MKEFISFPKIGVLRNIIQGINHQAHYVGQDENDNPIYDPTKINPSLKFTGTVKLHGTNAGVSYNRVDGIWAQSKNSIITIKNDNYNFAMFVERNKDTFSNLFKSLESHIRDDNTIITIFGEWSGGKIQKGVAINGLKNFLGIFAVKISYSKEDRFFLTNDKWSFLKSEENRIFNVQNWKSYKIEIDFEDVQKSLQKLTDLTNDVEKECPVGNAFGVSGIGEGIVWIHQSDKYGTIRMKVKGEKHSNTKIKKQIVAIDPEVLNNINEFVDYAVTENRLNQAIEQVFTIKNELLDIKKMGDFLRWISNDIFDEEQDVLVSSGLEMKKINKAISLKARNWFLKKWNVI